MGRGRSRGSTSSPTPSCPRPGCIWRCSFRASIPARGCASRAAAWRPPSTRSSSFEPDVFRWLLRANMFLLGLVAVFWGGRLVMAHRAAASSAARRKIRTVLIGIGAGISLPGLGLILSSGPLAHAVPTSVATMTPFLFALSIVYGIVGHDLFEVPGTLKRAAVYILLRGSIVGIHMLALVLFLSLLKANGVIETVNPLRPVHDHFRACRRVLLRSAAQRDAAPSRSPVLRTRAGPLAHPRPGGPSCRPRCAATRSAASFAGTRPSRCRTSTRRCSSG